MNRNNCFIRLPAISVAFGLLTVSASAQEDGVLTVTGAFEHTVLGQTVGMVWGESPALIEVTQSVENGVDVVIETFDDDTEVVTGFFEIGAGEKSVEATWGEPPPEGKVVPFASWGSNYAHSVEYLQFVYKSIGKAAANIYDGKRITTVCFWWIRAGVPVTGQTCSHANKNGNTWYSGPEVSAFAYDSLKPVAPVTTLNYKLTYTAL